MSQMAFFEIRVVKNNCRLKPIGFPCGMHEISSRAEAPAWKLEALARIERQLTLIETLAPESDEHRHATSTLLILQDCLQSMIEAKKLIAQLERRRRLFERYTKAG